MKLLYVSRSTTTHDVRFVRAWEQAGLTVHTLAMAQGDLTDPDRFTARVREVIGKFTPDLVQVGPLTYPGWQVVEAWDGPLLATSWGFDLMDDVIRDPAMRERAYQVLARADRVLVDNDAVRRRALAGGAREKSIIQFPWGVDTMTFTPTGDRGFETGDDAPFVIISVRRHEPLYRVGDLIDAVQSLAPMFPKLRLMLAGSGSLTASFRESIAIANLDHQVTFVGELAFFDLATFYRTADVYVSTSPVDGSSVALLEAMASGVPVVVASAEGNRQWVTDETGFTFLSGDPGHLARILQDMMTGDDVSRVEVRDRRDRALRLVRRDADWSRTSARFAGLADDVVRDWREQ